MVDDDVEVVALIARVLERDGRRVVGATGAREALAIAALDPPRLSSSRT